jgi:hypothetical protein
MAAMNPPVSNSIATPRRRYVLLPEDSNLSGRHPRIRRYRLASVGRRQGLDRPTAPLAGDARRV